MLTRSSERIFNPMCYIVYIYVSRCPKNALLIVVLIHFYYYVMLILKFYLECYHICWNHLFSVGKQTDIICGNVLLMCCYFCVIKCREWLFRECHYLFVKTFFFIRKPFFYMKSPFLYEDPFFIWRPLFSHEHPFFM